MPRATNGDCSLYYETFGSPSDPTLLLVNGLGSQCINYHEDWCEMFAAAGFHAVRFDNRDVGHSTHFTDAPLDEHGAAYRVVDMAADAVAVLDAVGAERSHVLGVSMGGAIVQHLAIGHRERLASMVAVMCSSGEPGYGGSTPEAAAHLTAPSPTDRESAVRDHIVGQEIWGSPGFGDEARWRRHAERAFDRCFDPAGVNRQYAALRAAPRWAAQLPLVTTPTLVLHGTADTLIDISGGRRIAELIPGARFVAIEGMGHDYPAELWPRWVAEVAGFCLADG
ncbi:MAG TPA: alpha/beta fold hydrolase [Ilumatobacter sp.]